MADLLAMLGTANNNPANNNSGTNNTNAAPEPLVTLKAGKMTHTLNPDNGKYKISPILARGQIEVHKSTTNTTNNRKNLRIQWRDRRTKEVDGTFCDLLIFEGDDDGENENKFEHVQDRVYILTSTGGDATFFWLQDVHTGQDEELTSKIAGYVRNPASAYPPDDPPVINSTTNTNNAGIAAANDMDNLGNILESVQRASASASSASTANTTSVPTTAVTTQPVPSSTASNNNTTSQLTLADLQGAMAGLATSNNNVTSTNNDVPLTEIATPEHISELGILEDEAVTNKLISLLPEGQQTKEHLLQHLNTACPQVRSALQSLTAALASGPEGFHGVVMNFQLPLDAANANLADNPIQAFLECLVSQVEREADGDGEKKEDTKEDDN